MPIKKVLIVEDDPVNARMLSDYLSAHGYATSLAMSGVEGLDKFYSEKPDLMLIDVLLPRKNGFELCFEVKRTEQGKSTHVLLMSAVYKDVLHAEKYSKYDLSAEAFLPKPFELSELLSRVRSLVGDSQTG